MIILSKTTTSKSSHLSGVRLRANLHPLRKLEICSYIHLKLLQSYACYYRASINILGWMALSSLVCHNDQTGVGHLQWRSCQQFSLFHGKCNTAQANASKDKRACQYNIEWQQLKQCLFHRWGNAQRYFLFGHSPIITWRLIYVDYVHHYQGSFQGGWLLKLAIFHRHRWHDIWGSLH